MAAVDAAPAMAALDSLLCGSSFSSADATDVSSNSVSVSSTPPTTVSPDSMSLASDSDLSKRETVTASSIEAVVTVTETTEIEIESPQQESGRQSPVAGDAIVVAEPPSSTEPSPVSRPRRARSSLPVYNLSKLAGTDVHSKRKSKGDTAQAKRRSTGSDDTAANRDNSIVGDSIDALAKGDARSTTKADASRRERSTTAPNTPRSARIAKKAAVSPAPAHLTRRATRLSGAATEDLATKLSALSKRGKKAVEKEISGLSRELLRLRDTNEFAHIDTRPVRYTVWSNGKYIDIDPSQETPASEPPRKKAKVEAKKAAEEEKSVEEKQESAPQPPKKRTKKWLEKGLYAGQDAPTDVLKGFTPQEKKKIASNPELMPSGKPNKALPLPMYNGLRILLNERDFKLPFDVCNPLPPGQPKPTAYRTMTKNRFVGDAASYWKKTPHFGDSSTCVCRAEDGCDEDCQNRIMLYECDDTNCNVGKDLCKNRAFQDLQERTKKGGRYRVGVEVYKTSDRGYGVRSNRCFEANQIIMEYTGEIITEAECERRMNEVYKDNECYYLMSFDQNMIIDATTGSIARFVNHSCSPNCRMIKWIVSGQPRMALFAGDRPIMTGEELTYDYNFDPFSAKNVQKCLCGSPNCRGVLGPKPKEVKVPKPAKEEKKKKVVKKTSKKISAKISAKGLTPAKAAPKRKLQDAFEFDGDDDEDTPATKKQKAANGLKKTLSSATIKVAKGAKDVAKGASKGVTSIKKSVASSISVAAQKKTTGSSSSSSKAKTKATTTTKTKTTKTTKATATIKRAMKSGVTPKTIAKKPAKSIAAAKTKAIAVSRSPSLTIVAAGVTPESSSASTPSAKEKKSASVSTPASATAKRDLPKLTISGGKTSSRKVTPSRKALEAGLATGSPMLARAAAAALTASGSPAKASPKIKLVGRA
ncbi:uncharacterized protein C8A04DRAFT_12235 [Dichotomopilus funicola]|uniref:Histone-lysine N-methyltransferase n=1 Tax=Dichotomopilus funicola TaxID=1934379 RepID=A0AAN6V2K6_9PEZI|nr:hypothetical protein C8A04DRAFT_12235 [Dichotomopilus funicola]